MGWLWYILTSLVSLGIALTVLVGTVAYIKSLTRREKRKKIHEPDPKAQVRDTMNREGVDYLFSQNPEDVSLKARDGLTLRGYFLPSPKPSNKLVVFSHGYTCTGPNEYGAFLRFYREELNYNILLPDHRSHGRSDGKFIGFAALEWRDILDWADVYVKRLGADTEVVLHGTSMGGATVMNCNAHNPPDYIKCVVEDCGFTNGYEMVTLAGRRDLGLKFMPCYWVAAAWFKIFTGKSIKKDSDPYGNIDKFTKPTLFIHGAEDTFVPTEMGVRCYEAATVPKDLLLIEGANHALAYYLGKDAYEAKLREWYAQWMPENVKA